MKVTCPATSATAQNCNGGASVGESDGCGTHVLVVVASEQGITLG
jgi:hypothetical protein